MSGCLADVAAALVDGELDHAGRERALRHLAHCGACRAEVDLQRRLKTRLSGVGAPAPSDALTERLLGLAGGSSSGRAPVPPPPATASPARSGGAPASRRPVGRAAATVRPGGRAPARPALRRRAVAGSAFALLGVAAALALGAPPQRPASTPVDPATEAFVTEFARTTSDGVTGPLTPVPALRAPTSTAGLGSAFVPLTRGAALTTGGGRSSR